MTKLDKIEKDVESLGPEDLARFREWFTEFDAANWDAKIEADVAGGKLDAIGERALAAHRARRSRPL